MLADCIVTSSDYVKGMEAGVDAKILLDFISILSVRLLLVEIDPKRFMPTYELVVCFRIRLLLLSLL